MKTAKHLGQGILSTFNISWNKYLYHHLERAISLQQRRASSEREGGGEDVHNNSIRIVLF
jgi:hypothetical protein